MANLRNLLPDLIAFHQEYSYLPVVPSFDVNDRF